MLLAAVTILAANRCFRHFTTGRLVVLALLTGVCALTRAELVLLIPLVALPTVLWQRTLPGRRRIALCGLAVAVAVAPMLPWFARNIAVFHHPVYLSDQFPVTVAAANNAQTYHGPLTASWCYTCLLTARFPPGDDESDEAIYWQRVAQRYIEAHKMRALEVAVDRVGLEWGLYAPLRVADQDFLEGWPTPVSDAWLIWYYPLMALAGAGAVILRRRRQPIYPLMAMFIVTTVTAFVTYGNYRFRSESEVAMVVLAAVTLDAVWSSLAGRPRPPRGTALRRSRRGRTCAPGPPGGRGMTEPADGPPGPSRNGSGPPADAASPGLDMILEEIDQVVEPVTESVAMAPAVGIAVAGGPMITLPEEDRPRRWNGRRLHPLGPGPGRPGGRRRPGRQRGRRTPGHRRGPAGHPPGLRGHRPAARAVLHPVHARLGRPGRGGPAGDRPAERGPRPPGQGLGGKVHRIALAGLAVEVVVVVLLQGWIARQLSLPDSQGIVLILVAAGVWILLCVDRGLLQAHRSYRGLAGSSSSRAGSALSACSGWSWPTWGWRGTPSESSSARCVATVHAHWLATRTWTTTRTRRRGPRSRRRPDSALVRRKLMADVSAAFVGLALLGLLQNVDVILLGRLEHANVGPYAAISVASKALVFGALALGAYLLPEATIRCPVRAGTPSASWG